MNKKQVLPSENAEYGRKTNINQQQWRKVTDVIIVIYVKYHGSLEARTT